MKIKQGMKKMMKKKEKKNHIVGLWIDLKRNIEKIIQLNQEQINQKELIKWLRD